jgi:hypothetical protein
MTTAITTTTKPTHHITTAAGNISAGRHSHSNQHQCTTPHHTTHHQHTTPHHTTPTNTATRPAKDAPLTHHHSKRYRHNIHAKQVLFVPKYQPQRWKLSRVLK